MNTLSLERSWESHRNGAESTANISYPQKI